MADARRWLTVSLGLGLALGMTATCIIPNTNHCMHFGGDDPCSAEGFVCDPCTPPSQSPNGDGCVAAENVLCGEDGTGSSTDVSPTVGTDTSSTTDEPVTTTTEPDTTVTNGETDPSTSTGELPMCTAKDGTYGGECPPEAPFCVDNMCTRCNDEMEFTSCDNAQMAPGTVCSDEGACVECTDEDLMACVQDTPLCDTESYECVGCTAHDQCPGGAGCHIFTGSCLSPTTVYTVETTITDVLDGVASGSNATIYLPSGTFNEAVQIPANSVVVIIANNDATIQADNGSRTIEVLNGATLYLSNLRVQNNFAPPAAGIEAAGDLRLDGVTVRFSGPGIISNAGRLHLERARIIDNTGTGVTANGTGQVTILSSIIAGNGTGSVAPQGFVTNDDTPFEIVYTTIAENEGSNAGAISSPTGTGTVRNSILVSDNAMNSVFGDGVTVTHSVIADTGLEAEKTNRPVAEGMLLLDGNYEISIGSVAEGVAVWMDGDPETDINGELRPTMDPMADAAGANLPN